MGVKAGSIRGRSTDVVRVSTGPATRSKTGRAEDPRARLRARRHRRHHVTRTRSWRTAFAKQLGCRCYSANLTQQLYQMARAAGLNKEDGLAVVKVLERLAGVQVKADATNRLLDARRRHLGRQHLPPVGVTRQHALGGPQRVVRAVDAARRLAVAHRLDGLE